MSTIIATIISSAGVIITTIIQVVNNNKKDNINEKLNEIQDSINQVDVTNIKNFLVKCLDEVEAGEILGKTTEERFWEAYDLYSNKYKQNSYIHKRVQILKDDNKLNRGDK